MFVLFLTSTGLGEEANRSLAALAISVRYRTDMDSTDVLIIGAGHSGVAAAAELRRAGFAGTITLVNGEQITPYHRPPLSKGWLKDGVTEVTGSLQAPNFFADQSIDLYSGDYVVSLDAGERVAYFSDGRALSFTDAVLATGALPRPLPGPAPDGVTLLSLRDATDAATLKACLTASSRLAIIGAGFIGLEVAATARHLGAEVCVIEREERVLARLASPELSEHLARLHSAHGVEILVRSSVERMTATTDSRASITIDSAPPRTVDSVLVAIGAIPNDSLAQAAGIACGNGVLVDNRGRTSEPHVFAIGDVARRPLHPYAESMRLESVQNATEHARIVAAEIAGTEAPRPAVPWFWSDQYDWKLQVAGLLPQSPVTELRGDPESGSFALLHRVDGRLLCVEAVNSSREFALGRRQIAIDVARAAQSGDTFTA